MEAAEDAGTVEIEWLPFELRPAPRPLLEVRGDHLRTDWTQNVYRRALAMGVEIHLPRYQPRSTLPGITHVDYSARLQTVDDMRNPRLARLMRTFFAKTGCPVLVNTSFNVRGEPIVCTPQDAYRCFLATDMDALVLENYILERREQPPMPVDDSWQSEFALD